MGIDCPAEAQIRRKVGERTGVLPSSNLYARISPHFLCGAATIPIGMRNRALLAKSGDHFYFWSGEAAEWLDSTVRVRTVQGLTLDEWMEEFNKLRMKNLLLMSPVEKRTKSRD